MQDKKENLFLWILDLEKLNDNLFMAIDWVLNLKVSSYFFVSTFFMTIAIFDRFKWT